MVIFCCSRDLTINIGSLGKAFIGKGLYTYVGSARLKKPLMRIYRHFSRDKTIRWHIDYLLKYCDAFLAFLLYGVGEDELYEILCDELPNVVDPVVKGFGASDKPHHYTHLFRVKSDDWLYFAKSLMSKLLKIDRLCFMEIVLP